ncbi:hypothetical protein ABW19_dt0210508 [Dactylella cylindrospora]|nr:hypothetical protein ABW19_dt0210508 [Dactylella cylindrospora]
MKWIHPKTGLRQDVPHVLVHPLLEKGGTGLQVLTEHNVVKVIVEDGKAVGVELIRNNKSQPVIPATAGISTPKTVRARKLVVVSAGALSSPAILERSGIGRRDILEKFGIPIVSELDGVGENYQDHNLVINAYTSNLPVEQSFDPILDGRRVPEEEIAALGNPNKTQYISWNGIDICSKYRPTEKELATMSDSFKELYERDYANEPTRPLMLTAVAPGFFGDHTVVPQAQYVAAPIYTAYPYSRGRVHISSTSVDSPVDFDPGYLSHDWDLEVLVWGYKRQREIVRRMKCFTGPEGIIAGPKFPETGKAKSWDWPLEDGAVTEYTEEDNEAIKKYIRDMVATSWHSCGTLAMRAKDNMGVLDGRLNVHGVKGLKVADMSIIPENVGANTYSTALVIGEKAACIIAEELGIKGF